MTPDLTYNCLFGWLSLLSFRLKTRRIGFWPWFACGNQCWHLKPSKWRHHIEGVSSNTVPKVTPQKPAPATAGSGSETRRIPLHLLQLWQAQFFALISDYFRDWAVTSALTPTFICTEQCIHCTPLTDTVGTESISRAESISFSNLT